MSVHKETDKSQLNETVFCLQPRGDSRNARRLLIIVPAFESGVMVVQ